MVWKTPTTETLTDGIVTLRRFHVDDVARIVDACSDAETARFVPLIPVPYSYWVHPAARGAGVATRALAVLSRWAVSDGGVQRLELTTHPENHASQRVAEKAGFVREGVLRSHLRFREGRRDSVLFSLLPSDI